MLQERTLRHLLLLVGRGVLNLEGNAHLVRKVELICKSLEVTKLRGAPYVISWVADGISQSTSVDAKRFSFHVRGDILGRSDRPKASVDFRTQNWNEAVAVWKTILNTEVLAPNALAPSKPVKQSRFGVWMGFLSGLLVLISILLASSLETTWVTFFMTAMTVPLILLNRKILLIGVCATLLSMLVEPALRNIIMVLGVVLLFQISESVIGPSYPWIVLPCLVSIVLIDRSAAVLVLVPFIVEGTISIVRDHKGRALAFFSLGVATLYFYVLGEVASKINFLEITAIFLLSLFVVGLYVPLASNLTMVRVSGPLVVAVGAIQSTNPDRLLLIAILVCWFFHWLVLTSQSRLRLLWQSKMQEEPTKSFTVTPIALRRR